jgi:selenocysteine-specific elongation factor
VSICRFSSCSVSEHLQILQLLGLKHGVIALTKVDRVDEERLSEARNEIGALTTNTFLEGAPIIETSVETGQGIDELRETLLAEKDEAAANLDAPFRLAIDRAFTVAGAGVVVTGTVQSGRVATDATLNLFPGNREVRVRGLRAQNKPVEAAEVGDRCAINIVGVDIGDVGRGQWLSSQASEGSRQFTLDLSVLDDFPRNLRHWLPVHLYQASAHSTGHIALLEEGRLAPGSRATVEIVSDEPLLVQRGDRLILRDQGLDRTLGGGAVISPMSVLGRRRSAVRLERLKADDASSAEEAFSRHLSLGSVDLASFKTTWQLGDSELDSLMAQNKCRHIDSLAVTEADWSRHLQTLLDEIDAQHQADKSLQGLKLSDLSGIIPDGLLDAALNQLVNDRKLILKTGRYLPDSHQVDLSDSERALLDKVTRHLDAPQPPSLGDLAKTLRQPIGQLSKQLLPLVAKKRLVKVSDSRYFLPDQVKALAALAQQLGVQGPFTVRQYRDASGMGRNVAIEMLEFFDSCGFTRRNGDTRTVAGELDRLNL